jgi:nucleoside-diphosphate-sugar epimerase
MPVVLITGGCGFLGGAFARRARAQGHEVVTADVSPGADRALDLADADEVAKLIRELRPQIIVHLAAGLTDSGERDPVATTRVNALGTAAVFAAAEANQVARVVYATSISAVGPTVGSVGDDARLRPGSVYGATKAFCEHLALVMSGRPGAPAYLGLRFGYVYGPGRVRGWVDVQRMIERVAAGERSIAFPDYPEPMDWTWIDDAAEVLIRGCEASLPSHAIVNVVGDKRLVRDAMAHLRRRFPDLVVQAVPARTPPTAWGLVNDGIGALLGMKPWTKLEEGIDRMIAQHG